MFHSGDVVFFRVSPMYMDYHGMESICKWCKETYPGNYKIDVTFDKQTESYIFDMLFETKQDELVFRLAHL